MRRATFTLFYGALALLMTARSEALDRLTLDDLWSDTRLYFTAPARWDAQEWLYFGGAVSAVAVAHQFDGRVRDHFAGSHPILDGKDKHSLRDAAPAALAVVGTWAFAKITDSPHGELEAYTMVEAAAFSTVTTEVLKYAAGRARPNESLRVNDWRTGGGSFPSLHSSAAFAIGTVLAESGPDDLRWTRRVLGYGIAGLTAYLRLHDNSHWLSDIVAGGAIGISSAAFSLHRRSERMQEDNELAFSVSPAEGGGVALNFQWTMSGGRGE